MLKLDRIELIKLDSLSRYLFSVSRDILTSSEMWYTMRILHLGVKIEPLPKLCDPRPECRSLLDVFIYY